jgi:hypothetical protein
MSQHALPRLAVFCLAFALAGTLACYQDKPAAPANASSARSGTDPIGLQPAPASAGAPRDSALGEIDKFALTPEVMARWTEAKQNLDATTKANPDIVKRLRAEGAPKSIGEMGQRLESEPKLESALKQAHMDGHSYMLASLALQQAMHGYQLKQMGKLNGMKVPPVVMANIDFVSTHMPLIMQSMRPAAALPAAPR